MCYLLFPETKNLTLEEIGILFGDKNIRSMSTSEVMPRSPGHEDEANLENGGIGGKLGRSDYLDYGRSEDVARSPA